MGKKEASEYSPESKPVLVQESKLFESIRGFSPSLKKPILILFISLFVISSLSLILFFNYDNIVGEAAYQAADYDNNKDLAADKPTLEKRFNLCILSNEECNDGIDNDCDGTCDYQNGDNSIFKKCSSNQTLCPGRVEKFMSRDLECDSCWDDSEEDKFRVGDDDNDGNPGSGSEFYPAGASFGGDADSGLSAGDEAYTVGNPTWDIVMTPEDVTEWFRLHDCWNNTDVISAVGGMGNLMDDDGIGGWSSDSLFADDFEVAFTLCDLDGDCYINTTAHTSCEGYFTDIFSSDSNVIDCDDVYSDDNPYCGPWDIAWLPTYCDDDPSRSTCAYCINPGADEVCNDGVDNDCNEEIDCEDGFCVGELGPDDETCEDTETICDDGFDNDADGSTDCEEVGCDGDSCGVGCECESLEATEIDCEDGIDNDGDSDTDGDDTDCFQPDMIVFSINATSDSNLSIVIMNNGTGTASVDSAVYDISYNVSVDGVLDSEIDPGIYTYLAGANESFNYGGLSMDDGEMIEVCIDSSEEVDESDETNNCLTYDYVGTDIMVGDVYVDEIIDINDVTFVTFLKNSHVDLIYGGNSQSSYNTTWYGFDLYMCDNGEYNFTSPPVCDAVFPIHADVYIDGIIDINDVTFVTFLKNSHTDLFYGGEGQGTYNTTWYGFDLYMCDSGEYNFTPGGIVTC